MVTTRRGFSSFSVDDLDAARGFYADTLGFRVTTMDDMGLLLSLDSGTHVFVYPKDEHVPATFTVMHLAVDDVDAVVDDLVAKGVPITTYDAFEHDEKGIVRGFMAGGDGAWFTDPAGNVIGLMDGEGARTFDELHG
jgi:predicted enzyme related to lactoylglutathione lyase